MLGRSHTPKFLGTSAEDSALLSSHTGEWERQVIIRPRCFAFLLGFNTVIFKEQTCTNYIRSILLFQMCWRKHRMRKRHCNFMPRSGKQGWSSGENTFLPPMWPGFKSRSRRHLWVEFVVRFLLSPTGFHQVLRFPTPIKDQPFQIPISFGLHGHI